MKFTTRRMSPCAPRARRAFALLVIASTAIAACGSDDNETADSTAVPAAPAATDASASDSTAPDGTASPGSTYAGSDGTAAPASGEPFRVVLIADQTGGAVPTSVPSLNGALLAIAEANANGGVNGRPIEPIVLDSQTTPEGGQAAARSAIEEEPDAIMMLASSTPLAGAAAVLDSANIPTVSNVGFDDLVLPARDWYFTTGFTYPQGAAYYVESARALLDGELSGKVLQFVGVQTPTIDGTLAIIEDLVEEEGAELRVERTQLNMSSFSSQAEKIASDAPDVVLSMDTANNSSLEAAALQTAGYTGPIVLSTAASADTLFEQINLPNVFAGRAALVPGPDDELYTLAQELDIDPEGSFFGVGYGTGYMMPQALQACDPSCDVAGFKDAMYGLGPVEVPFGTMYGPLEVGPDRHFAATSVQLFSWDAASSSAKALPDPIPLG